MTANKSFDIKTDYKEYSGDDFNDTFQAFDQLSQDAISLGRAFHFSGMVDLGEGQVRHVDVSGSTVSGISHVHTTKCEHGSEDFARRVFKHYTIQLQTAGSSIELASTKQDS